MTIPFLGQRPSDTPLSDISANIRTILNPNWQMQLEMQRRLMADPAQLAQIAEVERNSPGTIAKLGFGKKLTEIIQNTPETLQQKQGKELKNLQIQDAKNNLEQFGMVKKKFEDEQKDRSDRLAADKSLEGFNIQKEVENFVAGKPNQKFLLAMNNVSPETKQIFMANVQNLSSMRRLEQEHQLAMARINREQTLINAREDKSLERALNSNAIDSYQKTGVGSTQAWKTLLNPDGDGSTRLQQLMQNPLLAKTQVDRDLLSIGQHTQQDREAQTQMQKSTLLVKAQHAMSAAQQPNLKPGEVGSYTDEINQLYSGIKQIDPTFDRTVVQKGRDILIHDNNTGVTFDDDSKIPDVSQLPRAKGRTVRQTLDEAVQAWQNAPTFGSDNKSAIASKFKNKYGNEMFNLFWKRVKAE